MAEDDAAQPKTAPKKKPAAKRAKAAKKAAKPKTAAAQPTETPPPPQAPLSVIARMPVGLFGACLGLAGFATAWREAAVAYGSGIMFAKILFGIALGFFVAVLLLIAFKWLRHLETARLDFTDPEQRNILAAGTMTAMVLSSHLTASAPDFANAVWLVAGTANLALTIAILKQWVARRHRIANVTPAWFIPIVGNLIIPIVGAPLGYTDIGWMIFAVGLFFWFVLFVLVFQRLLFDEPLAARQRPNLFILVAPPALCFIAYVVLTDGRVDGVAIMFLGLSLFMLAVIVPHLRSMIRSPFGLTWWSAVFPMSALSVALTLFADATGHDWADFLAIATVAALTVGTLIISWKMILFVSSGGLSVVPPVQKPSS